MMRFFDSHTHLQDDRIWNVCHALIQRAVDTGVSKIVCCGSCEDDWERVAELSVKYKQIIPAFGIHPWFISGRTDQWIDWLEKLLNEIPTAAVGEIGLDHSLDKRDDAQQKVVFHQQLQIAKKMNRAVSIHCRKAWGDLLEILRIESGVNCGVIHSYSGSPEMIPVLLNYGLSISFSGSITSGSNKRGRLSVLQIPLDKLLIETDAPDIIPQGRSGFNEPSFIIDIAEKIASIRGMTIEDIARYSYENGMSIFGTMFSRPNTQTI